MTNSKVFPGKQWEYKHPGELGCSTEKLTAIANWFKTNAGDKKYRAVVVRGGYLIAEWYGGVTKEQKFAMASAAKSLYSSMLGIAIAEGKIGSADDKVVDYYPEMRDVAEDEGPKAERYAFEKDRAITFRQLISNTSGYMKPGEIPGTVFHYQTFGMNILTHAIAKQYNLYDSDDPERLPGCGKLIEEKIRNPIGGVWNYSYSNFQLQTNAKQRVFGYYTQIGADAHDMARMGYLWLNNGNWNGEQIIPRGWHEEAVHTAPAILEHCSEDEWKYGYGFWSNDHGKLWPNLPRDSYAASGAGSKHIWVCPSLDLVVAQSPGIWENQEENADGLLRWVVEAL
jgi:CubicO group peptidase (beta-lactamase class C family)